jgi:hypothetical protein
MPKAHPWIDRSCHSLTPAEEAALLTEIISAAKEQTSALRELIEARECPSLFRRAALDRYASHEGRQAEDFFEQLTDYKRELDDELRFLAHQWLVEFDPARIIRRGGTYRAGGWEAHLLNDPSPRVRWLATLIEK